MEMKARGMFYFLSDTFLNPSNNIEIPKWDVGKAGCLAFSFSR